MFHWQVVAVMILLIATLTMSWPSDNDNSKACLHFTGIAGGDARCFAFCKLQGKTGGSCSKKRCICYNDQDNNNQVNNNEDKKEKSKFPYIPKGKSNINCQDNSIICRVSCHNMEKSNGACVNGVCVCSEL